MPAIKVLELVGVSDQSFHNAVENALAEASKTVRNIRGIDVIHILGSGETKPAALTPGAEPQPNGAVHYPPAQPRLL